MSVWLTPQIVKFHCWSISSNGGGRVHGPALWGSGLLTCKVLSPKFSSGWMTRAEMISGRHLGFLLGPRWSGLGKVLGLVVSLGTILMKWDTCCDPDEDWNLTTTDVSSAFSFSETQIKKEGSVLIYLLAWSFFENLFILHGGSVEVSLGIGLDASWLADSWQFNE